MDYSACHYRNRNWVTVILKITNSRRPTLRCVRIPTPLDFLTIQPSFYSSLLLFLLTVLPFMHHRLRRSDFLCPWAPTSWTLVKARGHVRVTSTALTWKPRAIEATADPKTASVSPNAFESVVSVAPAKVTSLFKPTKSRSVQELDKKLALVSIRVRASYVTTSPTQPPHLDLSPLPILRHLGMRKVSRRSSQ